MREGTERIGTRVRRARRGKGITQISLAARIGVSESWLRGVEAGRITPDKHSVFDRLAAELDVDVAWLLGQPFQPAVPNQDAGHGSVPSLRTALRRTSLLLSGHPGIHAIAGRSTIVDLGRSVERVTRLRQAARLQEVMAALPELVEELNTGLLMGLGQELDNVHGLVVEASHVARMVLNQLGYHDLAWTAVENAAFAAARIGDPLLLACSAWDRCGVLLHTGSLSEVIAVAEAAMGPLELDLGSPASPVLSLWGALNLRCAIASARQSAEQAAWSYLLEAESAARRLGEGRNDYQTVFGPVNTAIHAVEIAVELGRPQVALKRCATFEVSTIPSKERHTHHAIGVARAYGQMKRDSTAVTVLRQAAEIAPQYVFNHPMARGLVEQIRQRGRPSAFSAGLGGLERAMGLV
jgi:transcriptional regulator with XRE-family HTH domain